jgi:hypothetical protein
LVRRALAGRTYAQRQTIAAAVLPIDPGTGALGEVVDLVTLEGKIGPHRIEQPFAKPHKVEFSPDGRFIVAPDKGLDRVFTFGLDPATSKLFPADPFGCRARDLRTAPRGLAEMVRVGWFKAVQVKSLTAHERKALLIARHQLVEMRVRIDNQLRGIPKTFGLVIGKCGHGQIGQRAEQLAEGHSGIDCVVASMVAVCDSLLQQIAVFDRAIWRLVKADDTARRLMTVPGVGPVVALAYMSIDDRGGDLLSLHPSPASDASAFSRMRAFVSCRAGCLPT